MTPKPLRFLLFGAGFWARYQLAAWGEQADAMLCVGVCDVSRERAESLAATVDAPAFTDPAEALATVRPDFADIVTPAETHAPLARLCHAQNVPAIVQKPLAPTLAEATELVSDAASGGHTLLVHENWRWQSPLRALNDVLQSGRIGEPFRARLMFNCSFPVFANQPFLATLKKFILVDIGSHVLDTARFLFGEAETVYATTARVNPAIAGEDVATVVLKMQSGVTVTVEMSYASRTEHERFPQTYAVVEGDGGSVELGPDYLVRTTDPTGTLIQRHAPSRYGWADPAYDLVQASMVPCQANLLAHLHGEETAETTGANNLQTVRLVFAAYQSAATNTVIDLRKFGESNEP